MAQQHNESQRQRRILLAVTGLSPQVVTETLYALAVGQATPWIPDEIHLITTGHGAEQARLNLLSSRPGWFHRIIRDYGLPAIRFGEEYIHPIHDRNGRVLNDIRNPEDNEVAADFITDRVRELTRDNGTTVYASIAGGRKTMGFYLGYAMSLYGRPQDRLSHVLVDTPFEGLPQFYYPTPYEAVIHTTQDGKQKTLDARDAKVTLADIPFVRLREGMPARLLDGRSSFSESVAAAQRALQPAQLVIDIVGGQIQAGGVEILMSPADLAFYLMLARRAKNGDGPLRYTDDGLAQHYLDEYALIVGRHSGLMEHAERRFLKAELEDVKAWFEERMSKCKRALVSGLDAAAARPYLFQKYGPRGSTRYGLALPPEAIEIRTKGVP